MKHLKHTLASCLFIVGIVYSSGRLIAQETSNNSSSSLSQFSGLIGGEWHIEGSYQVFEWGVGRKSVKSKGYSLIDGKSKLISEGIWVWHVGDKKLKGYFTAIEMPVEFFDYTTRFEGDNMMNDLKSYNADGSEENYFETWEFTDDDHYIWTLFELTAEGKQKVMGGKYERLNKSRKE